MVETRARASKRRKQTPSHLPEEIIVAILSKLPVKSLLQFRCVSKSWLAQISNPEFVKTHLICSSANDKEYNYHRVILKDMRCNLNDCSLQSLLYNSITELSDIDYPMKNFNIRWCDTANGLICLAGTNKSYTSTRIMENWPSPGVNLCIWNPSIRKWKIVPRVTSKMICCLSFRYGFGYDELHDDYKIVVLFDDNISSQRKVKIYSLKIDSWRTAGDFDQGGSLLGCSTKSVKGKLYWSTSSLSDHEYTIVSMDLANETWDKVVQPDYGEGKFDLKLGVLGSDLVVLCNYERNSDVWVMDDYGVEASWKKMFTISCLDCPVTYDYDYCPHSIMPFSPPFCQSYKGEILLSLTF